MSADKFGEEKKTIGKESCSRQDMFQVTEQEHHIGWRLVVVWLARWAHVRGDGGKGWRH